MGSLYSKRRRAADEKIKETTGRSELGLTENGYTIDVKNVVLRFLKKSFATSLHF